MDWEQETLGGAIQKLKELMDKIPSSGRDRQLILQALGCLKVVARMWGVRE